MFDSVYVLAKGGVCLYSGPPQNLRQHLNDCQIKCTQNESPIEKLIKISSYGLSDENTVKLYRNTNEIQSMISKEQMIAKHLNTSRPKAFKFIDFWYLFERFLLSYYYINCDYFVKIILIYTSMSLIISQLYSHEISKADGCFRANTTSNMSCFEEEDQKTILSQNQALLMFTSAISIILLSSVIAYGVARSIPIFQSEFENGQFNSINITFI